MKRIHFAWWLAAFALAAILAPDVPQASDMNGTIAIVGRDGNTGELGVAVLSHTPACGNHVPWVQGGVGAAAVLGNSNPEWGPRILALLRAGMPVQKAVDSLMHSDPLFNRRQIGAMDAEGRTGGYTGLELMYWSGGVIDNDVAVQGNLLAGGRVAESMIDTFRVTAKAGLPLAERLLAALDAGQARGGDRRGARSGALLIGRAGDRADYQSRYVYVRVDDGPNPLLALHRLYASYAASRLIEAHYYYADSYRRSKKGPEAEAEEARVKQIVDRTLADTTSAAAVLNAMAWQLAERGALLKEAQTAAERALAMKPKSPEILDTAAEVQIRLQHLDEALKLSKRALELDPRDEYIAARVKAIEKALAAGTEKVGR